MSGKKDRDARPPLLEDTDVKRWYDNVAGGSRVTADVYPWRLREFCGNSNVTPKDLISMSEDEQNNLLLDFVSSMEGEYAGSYNESIVKAVKSWLAHDAVEVSASLEQVHCSSSYIDRSINSIPENPWALKIGRIG